MALRSVRNQISPSRQEQVASLRQARRKALSQPQTSAELKVIAERTIRLGRDGPVVTPSLSPHLSRVDRSVIPEDVRSASRECSRSRSSSVVRDSEPIEERHRMVVPTVSIISEVEEPASAPVRLQIQEPELRFRPNVVAVVLNKEGQVLCGERSDFKDQSFWQCPQGGVDGSENIVDAAKREVEEELGLPSHKLRPLPDDYQPPDRFRYTFSKPVQKDGKYFDGQEQRVVMFMLDGDLEDCQLCVPGQPQEFSKVEWRKFEDIVPFVLPSKQQVYEKLEGVISNTLAACSPEKFWTMVMK